MESQVLCHTQISIKQITTALLSQIIFGGASIVQDKKPKASYSRKFNTLQRIYTTPEHELLSYIETFRENKNIFLRYPIIVIKDHENNTFSGLNMSDRVFLLDLTYHRV
jgi:hypothetical protein